jgi:predicted RNA binding protein YcfA (HicA-like mRNA interferase family)
VGTKLPRVSGKDVIAALRRGGFELTHVRGSHHYLRRAGGRIVAVPVHAGETLRLGTLGSILRAAELSADELGRAHARDRVS